MASAFSTIKNAIYTSSCKVYWRMGEWTREGGERIRVMHCAQMGREEYGIDPQKKDVRIN